MSGQAKRTLYHICDWALWALAIAGAALIAIFSVPQFDTYEYVAVSGIILCVLLRIPAAIHELGHLLFGAIAGLRFHAVTLSLFRFEKGVRVRFVGYRGDAAGETEMLPKDAKHIRGKMIAFTFGGALLNILFGGVLLSLYFLLPYHAALFFFVILALFSLHEGIRALLPAELPAGKTDGKVLIGFIKKERDEEVALKVLTAQGILNEHEFSAIPQELIFNAPVVREDLPAFSALLLLRMQYLLAIGDDRGAHEQLDRLNTLDELPEEVSEEIAHYNAYFAGEFVPARSKLFGVKRLEEQLVSRKSKNSADVAE